MNAVQPPLTLPLPRILTHDGWVNHSGVAPAASALALWAVEGGEVWLRSDGVAGKSHLLQALAREVDGALLLPIHDETVLGADELSALWLTTLQAGCWWLLDVSPDRLSENSQLALFHLIERGRRNAIPVVVGWRCSDAAITRPELLTRLRSMQQLELQPPREDRDLLAILESELSRMQWELHATVLRYLLAHTDRDLAALLHRLHTLHDRSLQRQCKPSLVNIRQLLEE